MAENKDYISYVNDNGGIHISEEVVAAVAASAVMDVEGVAGLRSGSSKESDRSTKKAAGKGIKVRLENNTLSVDVYLIAGSTLPLANLGTAVQQSVKSALEAATGVQVQCVNVTVCGVKGN